MMARKFSQRTIILLSSILSTNLFQLLGEILIVLSHRAFISPSNHIISFPGLFLELFRGYLQNVSHKELQVDLAKFISRYTYLRC
jgi:hypothetical protein